MIYDGLNHGVRWAEMWWVLAEKWRPYISIWCKLLDMCSCYKEDQWSFLLTWITIFPSMDKSLHTQKSVGWKYLSIPKLQRYNRWSLGMDKLFHPILYNRYNYLPMLGLEIIHISKRGSTAETTIMKYLRSSKLKIIDNNLKVNLSAVHNGWLVFYGRYVSNIFTRYDVVLTFHILDSFVARYHKSLLYS